MKKIATRILCATLMLTMLGSFAFAAELSADLAADYCFSEADFSCDAGTTLQGIYLASVPSASIGAIRLGERTMHSGDLLTVQDLSGLRLVASSDDGGEAELVYCPIAGNRLAEPKTLRIFMHQKENKPPIVGDSMLQTYKNVKNTGTLDAHDPEGGSLTFTLIQPPKRGTVEFGENATFTYTPVKNKIGKDSFTYTATDPAGHVSEPATVEIRVLKPNDTTTYADMQGDRDEFVALWLKNEKLFSGETLVGQSCFSPEKSVSRGEFLCMTLRLIGKEDTAAVSSGFSDETAAPKWMRGYLASGLRSGLVSGIRTERGVQFRPADGITAAEAAVILRNALHLPQPDTAATFSEEQDVPAWAVKSVSALTTAGISLPADDSSRPITRRDAAKLFYQIAGLLEK